LKDAVTLIGGKLVPVADTLPNTQFKVGSTAREQSFPPFPDWQEQKDELSMLKFMHVPVVPQATLDTSGQEASWEVAMWKRINDRAMAALKDMFRVERCVVW